MNVWIGDLVEMLFEFLKMTMTAMVRKLGGEHYYYIYGIIVLEMSSRFNAVVLVNETLHYVRYALCNRLTVL